MAQFLNWRCRLSTDFDDGQLLGNPCCACSSRLGIRRCNFAQLDAPDVEIVGAAARTGPLLFRPTQSRSRHDMLEEYLFGRSRWVVAPIAILVAVVVFATAPSSDRAIFFYAFGALCISIALASATSSRVAQFFGSLIGLAYFAAAICYVLWALFEGPYTSAHRRDPSLLNALFFMATFGLPGAVYAWRSRFGFRHIDSRGPNGPRTGANH